MTPYDASEAVVKIAETQHSPPAFLIAEGFAILHPSDYADLDDDLVSKLSEIAEARRLLREGKTTRALIGAAHALRWACERTSPPPRLAAWVEGGASCDRKALAIATKDATSGYLSGELSEAVDATLAALGERGSR